MDNNSENIRDDFSQNSFFKEENTLGTNKNMAGAVSSVRKNDKPAEIIKAELIDFLLSDSNYELIASEVPFFKGDRWADLIAIREDITIGFEIKSERDSVTKLLEQLTDYMKVFNMVYLVLAEKLKKRHEIKKVSKRVGIIMVSPKGTLSVHRKATPRVALDKSSLVTLLWRKDLEKLAPKKRDTEIACLRDYIARNCTLKSIQKQMNFSLKERYSESYRLFLKDRGDHTVIEDLRIITKLKKIPVLSNANID